MARPARKGLVYYPRDTDYYDDFKIVDLMYEHGTLGQTVFDVILTTIYRNGYYVELPIDKMVQLVIRTIGNRWVDKDSVMQAILYCGKIGLLDNDLLMRNVFTSTGIQRRYNEVTKRNAVDKSLYWLLDKCVKNTDNCSESNSFSAETRVFVAETNDFDAETSTNKIKENKIKENEIKCCDDCARARKNNDSDDYDKLCIVDKKYKVVMLTGRQMDDLLERLSLDEYNAYIEKLGAFIVEKDAHVKSHYETILKWVEEDRKKKG